MPRKLEVVLKNKLVLPRIPVDVPVASNTLPAVVDPVMDEPPELLEIINVYADATPFPRRENVGFEDAFHVLPSVLHIMLVAAVPAPYPPATHILPFHATACP